ncbi:MAG: hypothetical protein N2515_08805 [Deltaproteobacteria bacterium]|nr:hypothetical protein [Deltaproteobacteria bacterium]
MMLSGLALGLVDIAAIAALGVGCPLCTVAAPALIGWGAYKAWKAKHQEKHRPIQEQVKIIDCVFEAEEKV